MVGGPGDFQPGQRNNMRGWRGDNPSKCLLGTCREIHVRVYFEKPPIRRTTFLQPEGTDLLLLLNRLFGGQFAFPAKKCASLPPIRWSNPQAGAMSGPKPAHSVRQQLAFLAEASPQAGRKDRRWLERHDGDRNIPACGEKESQYSNCLFSSLSEASPRAGSDCQLASAISLSLLAEISID